MIQYYGYTISPNQIETGEGFLICRNVPIARTGDQVYLGQEIGLTGAEAGKTITVRRAPEEVFSDAALASFEGKPVTNDHPPDLVGPDDVKQYEMGHAQNVRRGVGEWTDYMVADLHIHDRELIDAVQGGKREISCGYECEYVDNGDGTFSQKHIRGNHVAVVNRGRAGKRAAILDSDTVKKEQARGPERKVTMSKRSLFYTLFGQAAKDKSPEEIDQMAQNLAAVMDEEGAAEGGAAKEEEDTKPAEDEAVIDGIVEKVLAKLAAKEAEPPAKDPIDAAIETLTGGKAPESEADSEVAAAASEESRVVPAEEMDKVCGMDQALAAAILKTMRPVVAAIGDQAQRQAVSDALIQCVTAKDSRDDIGAILQASKKNAESTAKKEKPAMDNEAVQAAYDAMNPHKRKENK